MLIRYGCEISMSCIAPTPMVTVLSAHLERTRDLRSAETVVVSRNIPTRTYIDSFGNQCRLFMAPEGGVSIWCDGTMADTGLPDAVDPSAGEIPVPDLPDECLLFLLGSRYCDTDAMSQEAWDRFGGVAPGWGRVQAICDFVNGHIKFDYQKARHTRTASEAFGERTGVCRDYAHLAITLCRCMNIPARYVNGYMGDIGVPVVDPMDFSAWMEVYLGGRWWTFDPRNNIPRIGRIVVARGRDAVDVPLVNSFGPHTLNSFRVWAYEVTDSIREAGKTGGAAAPELQLAPSSNDAR